MSDNVKHLLGVTTGVGDPGSKFYGELLSSEEEKKIDSSGELVVSKAPWSLVPTDLYLSIVGTRTQVSVACDRAFRGDSLWLGNTLLTVVVTTGKPKFISEVWGLALQLPSDLGQDALKQDYLTQWVIATTKEIFIGCETVLPKGKEDTLALWLVSTVDKYIRASGL